jgi:hypothetical protein
MCGQNNDAGVGRHDLNSGSHFETMQIPHGEIKQSNVWLSGRRERNGVPAVGAFASHPYGRIAPKQTADHLADAIMIIRDNHVQHIGLP